MRRGDVEVLVGLIIHLITFDFTRRNGEKSVSLWRRERKLRIEHVRDRRRRVQTGMIIIYKDLKI